MGSRARSAILAILAILVIVLYVQYGVRKNTATIAQLRGIHASVADSLQRARSVAAKRPEMEQRLEVLREQWAKAQQMLPEEKEIPELLRSVTTLGEKAKVKFLLFQPLPPKQEQYYTEIPIQLSVKSTYHSLGKFLSALGNLPRIINVSKLNLRPITGEVETIEATFTGTTYVLAKTREPAQPRRPRERS